jgi:HEAT repeat protein
MKDRVLAAIENLPGRERMATALFYINGYSQETIADFLEVPVSTVKNRLHTARRKLKAGMMEMVARTLKSHRPDDAFAQRIAQAVSVFAAKGPAHDSTTSPWQTARSREVEDLLRSGDEGIRVAKELARSENGRLRLMGILVLGLARDEKGREALIPLIHHESVKTRVAALRAYAMLVHPQRVSPFGIQTPADTAPKGLAPIIAKLRDEHPKVRFTAVRALSAYVHAHAPRVTRALREALEDSAHKVRHAAARALEIACPGCGRPPDYGR